ncbi:hypothetical protein HMPREF3216_00396 [Gardnerella vaginalis]|uniref:Uncharacterized protein n=1 Tax=Gardnerella vaginalis TaxID=2702 RepID=A0A133NQA3_GARVA|nr:hypothetical protein HMPREF3216_00396 [Gardnerella vaginalis]
MVSFPNHDSTNHDGEFNKKKDESKAKTSINSTNNYNAYAQQARTKSTERCSKKSTTKSITKSTKNQQKIARYKNAAYFVYTAFTIKAKRY